MSTTAQVEANRANALLSTGPLTPETKAISSLNALKTGLNGRTIMLPSDDAAAYQQHVVASFELKYEPGTLLTYLFQSPYNYACYDGEHTLPLFDKSWKANGHQTAASNAQN